MEYNWLVYLSNPYKSMITPNVSDIKANLIEDVIKKKRKAREAASIL
jgi:hypothetical protein